jgi:hypothetical protein
MATAMAMDNNTTAPSKLAQAGMFQMYILVLTISNLSQNANRLSALRTYPFTL